MINEKLLNIVKEVVISSKSRLLAQKENKFTIKVAKSANKILVKQAVEMVWKDMKVSKVAIMNTAKKTKAFKGKKFVKHGYKKAIISISQGSVAGQSVGN